MSIAVWNTAAGDVARAQVRVPLDVSRQTSLPIAEQCDADLLVQFATSHCEASFRQLVIRHGGLVLSVCRRVLKSEADAEDAFQATFLVLAKKAGSVRHGGALAAWLYQTAFRLAVRSRQRRVMRREETLEDDMMPASHSMLQIAADHERTIVDEELSRLPEQLRLPVFLCCLEGRTREEAAEILGWSIGSVKGRLERGRQQLRRRLLLRGVSLTIVLAAFQCVPVTAHAAVPVVSAQLIASTVRGGVDYADGISPVSDISPGAMTLAEGNSIMLGLTATKMFAASVATLGLLTLAGLGIAGPGSEAYEPISSQLTPSASQSPAVLVAYFADGEKSPSGEKSGLKDGEKPVKTGVRDGEKPNKEGLRDGEQPKKVGPRDGEQPKKVGPRDGEGPVKAGVKEGERSQKEGAAERVKEGAGKSPEGAGPFKKGEGANPQPVKKPGMANFEPETAREKLLFQMILELRSELEAMKRETMALREKAGAKDGAPLKSREGESKPREGEAPKKTPGF